MRCPKCGTWVNARDMKKLNTTVVENEKTEVGLFECAECNHIFETLLRILRVGRNGTVVETEDFERERSGCGKLMPVTVGFCLFCGKEFEKVGSLEQVSVYRCPVDGITYPVYDGHCPAHNLDAFDLVDPKLIGGAHLVRCFMCGSTMVLAGPEGIFHGKCRSCGQEGYVVNYKGYFICGACLYSISLTDGSYIGPP